MKPDNIHDALDHLDENLIAETDALRHNKRAKRRRLLPVGLAACLCATVIGVLTPILSGSAAAVDLMEGVQANAVPTDADLGANAAAIIDFALRLFQNSAREGQNTLISPLSVLCALGMTANGAEGETLSQMESVLGLDRDTLNAWLHTYTASLSYSKSCTLELANSIWFREGGSFAVNEDFLQTNADYYGAGLYSAPFDRSTVKDINRWVKENTDGMIPEIIDEISGETVMYLINALSFDATWQTIYTENSVRDGTFTTEDGEQRQVELMYSCETMYLEDENAVGFLKYYTGGRYAFAALLPDEGVSVADYVEGLTGERLYTLLNQPENTTVWAAIPRFEGETTLELSGVLKSMGMTDAFDPEEADLSAMGTSATGSLHISRVLHKTCIAVDERGTRAGAVTSVDVNDTASPEEPKIVYLNRPFVYFLIDCGTGLPFFIGTMMDVNR